MSSNALELRSVDTVASMAVKVLAGKAGYTSLLPEWDRLALGRGTHFLHFPGWYGAELDVLEDDSQVFFVALYEDDTLFAVLPFQRVFIHRRHVTLPVLQLFYLNEMGVNDVVADRPLLPYRRDILRALREHVPYFAFIRWQCVMENSCAASLLRAGAVSRITHVSKYLDLSSGLASFWKNYSSKFRKGLQKKLRKAEEQGELRLLFATRPAELALAFEDFIAVEDASWKGECGTSIKKQPRKLAYYQRLLRYYGDRGLCQINILYSDDTPIAAQFGLRIGGRLYLLKIGFREDFAAVSPGYLALYKLIEQSAQRGDVRSISFVTGVDWIDRWHPSHLTVGVYYLGNGTWPSELLVRAVARLVQLREWCKKQPKTAEVVESED